MKTQHSQKKKKIQRTVTPVKFLEIQWPGVCKDFSSKVKDQLLLIQPTPPHRVTVLGRHVWTLEAM